MTNRADQLNRALGIRCAKLAARGLTHRAIAEVVGKLPKQIKALIALGQRVQQIDSTGAISDLVAPVPDSLQNAGDGPPPPTTRSSDRSAQGG